MKILGWIMLIAPFIGIFVYAAYIHSVMDAVLMFSSIAILVGWLLAGVGFIFHDRLR